MNDTTQPPQHGGTPRTDVVASFLNALSTQTSEQFVLADFARTLERELIAATAFADEETARYNKMSDKESETHRQLTATLDEKRKVERERDHWERGTKSWNKMAVELGCLVGVSDNEVPWFDKSKAALNAMRSRLALAEGLVEALQSIDNVSHTPEAASMKREALRRWAESRTEGTDWNAVRKEHDALKDTVEQERNLSSQAVPITPETVVPFPCWLWHPASDEWHKYLYLPNSAQILGWKQCGYTHYHPDQPQAPTEKPQ